MQKSILIISDEPYMYGVLELILTKENHNVVKFEKNSQSLKDIELSKPDLIIIDFVLPDISGFKICKEIKDNPNLADIPVILLSSKSDDQDVIIGFSLGCTDYITKPFNERILAARANAAMRKLCISCRYCVNNKTSKIKVNDLYIDPLTFEVTIKNKFVNLTPLEFKLLYFLAKNQNKVYTRDQLFKELYENNYDEKGDRAIDILINRIRKKTGKYANNIESIYGIGYSFKIANSINN